MADFTDVVKEWLQPTRRRSRYSVAQLAERLKVSAIKVYRWCEPERRAQLPAEYVGELTVMQADTLVIDRICADAGGFFVPVVGKPLGFEQVSQCITEFGEFVAVVGQAVEDGTLSRDEAERIVKEGYEVLAALYPIIQEARLRLGEDV